ncbi:MAG: hypothetical protein Q9209_004710 [Squamulea sp. 1 TL-2023]
MTIYRTIQSNILLHLSKNSDDRWNVFNQAMTLLRKGMKATSPLNIPEPEKWPNFELYVPQIHPGIARRLCADSRRSGHLNVHAGRASEGREALNTAIHIMDDEKVEKTVSLRGDDHARLGILMSSDLRETLLDIRHKEFEGKPRYEISRQDETRLYYVECDVAWTH